MNRDAIIGLIALQTLSAPAVAAYETMKKSKGRSFNAETLAEKMEGTDADSLADPLAALTAAGLISTVTPEGATEPNGWTVPKATAADLSGAAANGVGTKTHTTRTANTNLVMYKGDTVVFKTHTLSKEYKDLNQKVQYGTLNRTHINEEGFQYFDAKKLAEFGGEEIGAKCAKKSSGLFLVDDNGIPYENPFEAPVPEASVEMIGLKKAAKEVFKPEVAGSQPINLDEMEGTAVLIFFAPASPDSRAMEAAFAAAEAEYGSKVLTVQFDAYWNSRVSAQFGLRQVPSIIVLKNGNVESQVAGILDQDAVNAVFDSAVKAQGKKAVLAELPLVPAPVKEVKAEAKAEDGATDGASADGASDENSSSEEGSTEA